MAFLAKNSNCKWAFQLRKLKYKDFEGSTFFSQFAKLSIVSSPVVSPNYSTKRKNGLLSPSWNHKNYAFSLLGVLPPQHFMSTNSQTEYFKAASTNIETGSQFGQSSSDQVLFTNSPISDSGREVLDSVTTTLADLPSIVDVAEPTLSSLGIASWYTPVGLVENFLEFLHISGNCPWWVCIVAATATARVLMFPIFVKTQRNAARFANHMPQLQYLQTKFGESRRAGNAFETSKLANEIMVFMKEHNINPMKNAIWPLAQAPIFISFFFALRDMAKLPVESMKIGGFSWITDLTIPDPYYIMPLVASTTLYIVLKIGAESGVRMENMKMTRYFLMALPVVMFPFAMHFPSAVLFYWCTNNFLTLGLVLMLKINGMRQYFGIPQISTPDPKFIPEKKGFVKSLKDAYQDQKIISALDERERIDEIRFKKAGTGPIPRTYAYDPTKPRPGIAASAAASRTGSSSSGIK